MKKRLKELIGRTSPVSQAITNLIKEIEKYVDAETELMEDSKNSVLALRTYIDQETLKNNDIFKDQAPIYEEIDGWREKLITQMKEQVLAPLNELLEASENLTDKEKELEDAQKKASSAQKKLTKLESKSMEKVTGQMLRTADDILIGAKSSVVQLEIQVNNLTEQFESDKMAMIKYILKNFYDIKSEFFNNSANSMSSKDQNLEKEAIKEIASPEASKPESAEPSEISEEIEESEEPKEPEEQKAPEEPKKKDTLDFDSLL